MDVVGEARSVLAGRVLEQRLCHSHPAYLLDRVQCIDHTSGEVFKFQLLDETEPWYWQRPLLDEWLTSSKHISLKARQLGITWLAGGLALWQALCVPGSNVLIVSTKEEEAVNVVNRIWDMFQSLPLHLRFGVEVLKPMRARPTSDIQFQFGNKKVSSIRGLTSQPHAGHGSVAGLVILDEASRQPYAHETWKAVLPTTQGGGRVIVISTGNGVSSSEGGNFFHHLWVNADAYGLEKRFLPWSLNPDRDDHWYRVHAEALPPADRGEQYPRTEKEAFILTGSPYFDEDALFAYEEKIAEPLYRFDFEVVGSGSEARQSKGKLGHIRVYEEPEAGVRYAIGADVATGRGKDFSAAYVMRLDQPRIVAEFHAKIDSDLYATQLHFLGRWYETALIAVEMGGGYGEAINIPLRDGRAGRPPYPRLYRHVLSSRPDLPVAKPFGFPINSKTRPLVLSQIEKAIREQTLPFLTQRLYDECLTFVHTPESDPSPRALPGCNDDCVFAVAIALEMYRLKGQHPNRPSTWREATYRPSYPWQKGKQGMTEKEIEARYPKGTNA